MKIKLDENLGERGAALFRAAGHDVATVPHQHMSGAGDRELIDVCRREGRCLVTLDLDFSNPLVFKPWEYAGIAVLRLPPRSLDMELWEACEVLVRGSASRRSLADCGSSKRDGSASTGPTTWSRESCEDACSDARG